MNGSSITQFVLSGLVVVAALLTVGGTRLAACSCIESPAPCESVWNADAVFVATVVGLGATIEQHDDVAVGSQTVRVTRRERVVHLKVTEVFRGVEVGTLEAHTSTSSASCGYDFMAGRNYLVYAHRNPSSGALRVSLCSRTRLAANAVPDLAYLRGPFVVPAEAGVVRGTVTRQDPPLGPRDGMRRAPFPGADIRLEGYSRAYTATSADDGSYEFRVPAGEYRMLVNVRDGVYAWPGADGRSLTLKDNRGCAVADVVVRPDSRIAGRLLDGSGQPVPFMSVELAPADQVTSDWLSASTRTLTDVRGHFEFTRQDPGQYAPGLTLRRSKREGVDLAVWLNADGSGQPVPTAVESEGRVDLGDLRLPSGVTTITVSGVVVSADGTPVGDAQVLVADPFGAPVLTDKDGRFSLTVVAGRTYRLSAEVHPSSTRQRRFASGRSEPFEAAGELKPIRLVIAEVR